MDTAQFIFSIIVGGLCGIAIWWLYHLPSHDLEGEMFAKLNADLDEIFADVNRLHAKQQHLFNDLERDLERDLTDLRDRLDPNTIEVTPEEFEPKQLPDHTANGTGER